MDDHKRLDPRLNPTIENLARAIYVVNRHAKTAPNPKYLYALKKKALLKLVQEGKATKKGLHFSNNPKLSQHTRTQVFSLYQGIFVCFWK